jgi:acyl transferase domain-containing protein
MFDDQSCSSPRLRSRFRPGPAVFLEVGAHPSMQSSLNDCLAAQGVEGRVLHSLSRKTDESMQILSNLAQLHFGSAKIDWAAVNQTAGQMVTLPSYPWHYESYWQEQGESTRRLLPIRHEFLQRRLVVARPTWQFDADLRVFSYLQDHRLWDGVVFPAAGFAEIGLAIASELFPEEPYAVEELELLKATVRASELTACRRFKSPMMRTTDRSASSAGLTKNRTGNFTLPVDSCLFRPKSPFAETVDLAQIRARIGNDVTHEQLYTELGMMGYQFGPVFSQIEQVSCEPGESLAKNRCPGVDR